MNKNVFKTAIFLIATAILTGCSSDDPSENPDGPDNPEVEYYAHKAILEDFTATGCVACPIGSFIIEELDKSTYSDKVIAIGIHDNFQNEVDPYRIPAAASAYARHMQVSFYPSLFWNRNKPAWNKPETNIGGKYDENNNTVYFLDMDVFTPYINTTGYLKEKSNIGIKINSTINNTDGEVTFSLKFSEDLNSNLKYVIYLLEDNLIHRQANGTPLYGNTNGTGRWENNFVHNHVLRATNNILGEDIAAAETVTGTEFTKTVSLTYPTIKTENSKVVVAILNDKGIVLNAQIANVNTIQDYQVVK